MEHSSSRYKSDITPYASKNKILYRKDSNLQKESWGNKQNPALIDSAVTFLFKWGSES